MALSDNEQLDFFGIMVQGMPKLLQVSEGNISLIEHETGLHPLLHCHVMVNGETPQS